jgi:ABC-type bacteriocin/lantibiotic exporter with double-glycine peptidase domain
VPVVTQMTPTECGAACLAMVLGYHGRPTRLSECRERCGSGRDGSSALAIAQAGRSFGLRVRAFSSANGDLGEVPLPAVAHWERNHFVVVERFASDRVELADPALGRRKVTRDEWAAGFSGVVLTFEPGASLEGSSGEPRGPTWSAYLRDLLRAPGVRGPLAQIVAASLILQGLGLALPLFTKIVVDDLLPARIEGLLPALALGMGAWVAALTLTSYLRSALVIFVQTRLDAQLMLGFFEHLLSLPFRFFQQRTSGDLLMRLGSNALLREIVTTQTVSAIFDSLLVALTMAILLAWAPLFGLIAAALGGIQVACLLATMSWIRRITQRDLQAQAQSQSFLVEALSGIATLKALGAEPRAVARFTDLFRKQLRISVQGSHASALIETAMSTLRLLAPLLLLLVGVAAVLRGSMTLGAMLALNALASQFLNPLASLVNMAHSLQVAGAHLERISDVLEADPEQAEGEGRAVETIRGRIELLDVSFRYDPGAPLAVNAVALTIEPGEKLALVGRTGSGKSTLAKLILGLYSPTGGEVRIDGHPIDRMRLRELRPHFGVVLQEPFLFSGTIRQNVSMDDPDLPLERVVEACRLAAIEEEIAAMPMGYDTLLTEGGTGLSGGQRQRIALARALARRPSLLVLDEATSHLDVATESRVEASLAAIACTRIVIAHRLSTIRDADRIVVLEGGSVVEVGSHEELLERRGAYATLQKRQLA